MGSGIKPNYNSDRPSTGPGYQIEDKDGNHGPGNSQPITSGYGQIGNGNQVPSNPNKPSSNLGFQIDHSHSGSITTGHGNVGSNGASNIALTASANANEAGASVHQSGSVNTNSHGAAASVGFEANVNHGTRPSSIPETHTIDSNTGGTFPLTNTVSSSGASVNLNVNVGLEKTPHGGGLHHGSVAGNIDASVGVSGTASIGTIL